MDSHSRIQQALRKAQHDLLTSRNAAGHWTGNLASSALSTATAVVALSLVQRHAASPPAGLSELIASGLQWLADHANPDGGWGDTVLSHSNLSTTALGWAAFGAVPGADDQFRPVVRRSEAWIQHRVGGIQPPQLAPAIIERYGCDRTFSVPILTMCALSGRLGPERQAWKWVIPLPFELAVFPHRWFAALRLPVVSYALPALIAIGQVRHHHRPSLNPLARGARILARRRTLNVLQSIQPANGGFLEATPLTSFVTMSLAASGQAEHPVTRKGAEFISQSVRPDGSWPIDTNLATWVTTLAVNALSGDSPSPANLPPELSPVPLSDRQKIQDWLLAQQYQQIHPYTDAPPGGWAWTPLPGGVPDADDTAGALIALRHLDLINDQVRQAAQAGVRWLLDLQNRDGGIPTFCRGWGKLPFDRSSPDLTSHAVRAWVLWQNEMPRILQTRICAAIRRALAYLVKTQSTEGAWVPLWFGNQHAPNEENPTYGTARVLKALAALVNAGFQQASAPLARGTQWLIRAQHSEGGWGGMPGGPVSIEETALALEALADVTDSQALSEMPCQETLLKTVKTGAVWLAERVEQDQWLQPAPIGFYFARLWYFESLYPQIFAVGALSRFARTLSKT